MSSTNRFEGDDPLVVRGERVVVRPGEVLEAIGLAEALKSECYLTRTAVEIAVEIET